MLFLNAVLFFSFQCIQQKNKMQRSVYDPTQNKNICLNITKKYTSIVIEGARHIKIEFNNQTFKSKYYNFGLDLGNKTGLLHINLQKAHKKLLLMMNSFDDDCQTRITTNDPMLQSNNTSSEKICLFHAISSSGLIFLSGENEINISNITCTQKRKICSENHLPLEQFEFPYEIQGINSHFQVYTEISPSLIYYILTSNRTLQDNDPIQLLEELNSMVVDFEEYTELEKFFTDFKCYFLMLLIICSTIFSFKSNRDTDSENEPLLNDNTENVNSQSPL